MKQSFKTLGLICLTLILTLSVFCLNSVGIVYGASANTYEYNANVVENYDTTFLNGIESVDSVKFDYYSYFHYHFTDAQTVSGALESYRSISSSDFCGNTSIIGFKYNISDYINYDTNSANTLNFMLYGKFVITQNSYKSPATNSTMYRYSFTGTCTDFYVTDFFFSFNNNIFQYASINYKASPRSFVSTDTNLSDYLDFNSETNYSYDISTVLSFLNVLDNKDYNLLKNLQNGTGFSTGAMRYAASTVQLWTKEYYSSSDINKYANLNTSSIKATQSPYADLNPYFWFSFRTDENFYQTTGKYTVESKLYITNFIVTVNRPVERLENALVLYNYDYDNAISRVNHIEYALSKNGDKYVAKYDGKLPNSRFIGIVSEDLQNRIYDEYIYIYLTFDNNTIDISKLGTFSLGFDFNFSKYYEPFVIDTINVGDYNLPILNKPRDWWDFGGWIMYAFVFILFYNPVVSTFAPYLTHFMALLYNSLTFITGFALGQFLFALIGFSILFGFFSSALPFKSVPKIFDQVSNGTTKIIVKGGTSVANNYAYLNANKKVKKSSIEKYRLQQSNLNSLYASGKISAEKYDKRVAKLNKKYKL